MKYITIPLILAGLFFCTSLQAQLKTKPFAPANPTPTHFKASEFKVNPRFQTGIPVAPRNLPSGLPFQSVDLTTVPNAAFPSLRVLARDKHGLPIFIEGKLADQHRQLPLEEQAFLFLETISHLTKIKDARGEFLLMKTNTDQEGFTHLQMHQIYKGIPVYGSEIRLHARNGVVQVFNGRYLPTPQLENLTPQVDAQQARRLVNTDLEGITNLRLLSEWEKQFTVDTDTPPQLIIYNDVQNDDLPVLAWRIEAVPNLLEHWTYFVDAQSGAVIHRRKNTCSFSPHHLYHPGAESCSPEVNLTAPLIPHLPGTTTMLPPGPTTAVANDLKGQARTINVYEEGGTYVLLDAGRVMFDPASNIPNDTRGAIITVNALNTHPANDDFGAEYILSNNNSWNVPAAISAHYHAGECYEFYRQIHSRNSINGQGGNIVSFIEVSETDGSDMDNAFWNGAAMFYGNGNQYFSNPLQKSLDTGGHEMTHGVVQNTANLVYEGQAGALNESFADVFGVLIDPTNWQLGEDIVNSSFYPSGALRDMSNPNQGGSGLSSPGWQPAHMNQFQDLPNTPQGDNGGVHINSGIPNHAFYLYANSVGLSKAGTTYYRALSEYLTLNSQFIDARLAVVRAATDLYGANSTEVNTAKSAFDQVGITNGSGSSGPPDLEINPGDDFILVSDGNLDGLYLFDGNTVPQITTTSIISRPSITDDGSAIIFVADDNTIRIMEYNPNLGQYEEFFLEQNPQTIWRNAAISKDGSKLAALTTDYDNFIFVFDFNTGQGLDFELYNPTSAQGVTTDDVQYADFIEWDYAGERILYDAYNVLDDDFGNTSDYWDVGLIRVWDNAFNNFDDGFIIKIFNGLPDNTGVGNPTFAKNSPLVVALDFIGDAQNFSDFTILGVDLIAGEVGEISQNSILGYPNYSVNDNQMIFDAEDFSTGNNLEIINLNADKITSNGSSQALIEGGKWGVWFATGERELVGIQDLQALNNQLLLMPNPVKDQATLSFTAETNGKAMIEIFDLLGRSLQQEQQAVQKGENQLNLSLGDLPDGTYFVRLRMNGATGTVSLVKN
ncbi:MAG: hypothetical protein DHS20C18_05490 [Saprospiraceae bacterium]|nr:MAG: hypothetical protein DHS20C18_05490 [Saprospiraceae bacterium]